MPNSAEAKQALRDLCLSSEGSCLASRLRRL